MIANGFWVTIGVCLALTTFGLIAWAVIFCGNYLLKKWQFREQFLELAPQYVEYCIGQQDFEEVLIVETLIEKLKNKEKVDSKILNQYWIDTKEVFYEDEDDESYYMVQKKILRKKGSN